jgi:Protein of unknown function (DUF3489)
MHKPTAKRRNDLISKRNKKALIKSADQPPLAKPVKHKRRIAAAADQRRQPSAKLQQHSESKKARIIAMLRAPNGATIEAMMRATGWQPHSIRGFLAGVIRKKLGLNLVSAATESGRVYRIADRSAERIKPAA